MHDLPFHPTTGVQALGFLKSGTPIWPVMGGSQPLGDPGGAPPAGDPPQGDPPPADPPQSDPPNSDRGFPENTPWRDMTPDQQVAYWKFHDRQKSNRLDAYDGITPDEAKRLRDEADQRRREGLQPSERALEDARTEATNAAMQAAAAQWAPQFAEAVVGQFVSDEDQRSAVMAGIDPMRFMKDGKFDTDALVGHLTGLSVAFGGNGSGDHQPRQWGQSGDRPPAPSASDEGLAEARRRGYIE